jgi:5-methylcytosine-specific restriction enzyme subunit McrC
VGQGVWQLIPRGRVGAVRIDDVDVVVTPKVGIARLLFLLG